MRDWTENGNDLESKKQGSNIRERQSKSQNGSKGIAHDAKASVGLDWSMSRMFWERFLKKKIDRMPQIFGHIKRTVIPEGV